MTAKNAELLTTDRAFRVVPVADIGVDKTYQRDVKGKHRRIVTDFDKDAFGVLPLWPNGRTAACG